jgi:mannobiose 2-epimerase
MTDTNRTDAQFPGAPLRTGLADEVEANLRDHILRCWYPHAVDTVRGGFFQNFDASWNRPPEAPNLKSIVYQARLTWTAAAASTRTAHAVPSDAADYRTWARHGARCLREKLWDAQYGGFFWQVSADGSADGPLGVRKQVYGIAFGIYALATVGRATLDADAVDLARSAFLWLDRNAHDAASGGYHELLERDGTPVLVPNTDGRGRTRDAIGTPFGGKSMNTHIHLLEAFTALYQAWPDPVLGQRLDEVLEIVRERIASPDAGYLHMFLTADWRPTSEEDSFGHDVETAFLLAEAAETLGRPDDARTRYVARRLVDHALDVGWDTAHGGFFDEGHPDGPATGRDKIWWTQAEGLNALLLMETRYGGETDRYRRAFEMLWDFVRQHQIDAQHHGWLTRVREDGAPIPGMNKSDAWKDPYHQGRALIHVAGMLRHGGGTHADSADTAATA